MLLKYNGTRPLSIQMGGMDASVKVFIPGGNEIKDSDWEIIKKHPDIARKIEAKEIEVLSEAAPAKTDDNTSELSALSAKDAKKLVEETFDVVLLRKWREEETRKPVSNSIDDQLKKIEDERKNDNTQE